MALFVLLYAVVAPCKLLPVTHARPCKYSTVSEKINIRLDIWRNDAILRKTNIKWELLK